MKTIKNSTLIFISGSGRNVGKSFLMEKLIASKASFNCVSLKTSSHFHELTSLQEIIHQEEGLIICKENDKQSSKDSSRFLRAGADLSYYVQLKDEKLPDLANWVIKNITSDYLFIESMTLGQYLRANHAFYIQKKTDKKCSWNFNYITLPSDDLLSGNLILPRI